MELIPAPATGAIPEPAKRQKTTEIFLIVRIEPDGATVKAVGRDAWALRHLINAGESGITPLERPAPRWSHYVWKLRGMGLVIETIDEAHGGPFSGHHARYVLRSEISILEDKLGMAA